MKIYHLDYSKKKAFYFLIFLSLLKMSNGFRLLIVSMYERIFVGRQHRDKAKSKYLIGCLNMIHGDDKQAICLFRQAYETWSKTLKVQHPDRNMCFKKR